MRLIVTRPLDDGRLLAAHLEAAGHEVLLAPLLQIKFRLTRPLPRKEYQAVLITSANSARALARHPDLPRVRSALAITVGPASAEAAQTAGFEPVVEAEGDVPALVGYVVQKLSADRGPLLYAAGSVTTGDLERTLRNAGFEVDRCILYDAEPAVALPDDCISAIEKGLVEGVLLFSPRTARIWAELILRHGLKHGAAALRHYCLSANVAAVVRATFGTGAGIAIAARPDEPSLLALIGAAV